MTYRSASAEISGHTNTITPTAMPSRLEKTSHPRSLPADALKAPIRPTRPVASANAPKTITSAVRLIPGQARMTTPNASESRPFRPSAHLTFVSCVPAILVARSKLDSIVDLLLLAFDDLTVARRRVAGNRR